MVINRIAGVLLLIGGATLWRGAASEKPAKQFLNFGDKTPPGYTQVVTSRPGRMVFISGQGGADEGGKLPADFASQAKNTFENIHVASGSNPSRRADEFGSRARNGRYAQTRDRV